MAAKEKFIIAAGCATRISDTQKGDTTIVLLHGYLESLDIWEEFTKLIEKSARVIALDLPGHGISEVKGDKHTTEFIAGVVCGVLNNLGIDKAIIAGHSLGGYVALQFLSQYPGRTAGIVLFHSTPNQDTEEKREDRRREIALIESGKKDILARTSAGKGFAEQNRKRFADEMEDIFEQAVMTEDDGILAILRGMIERHDHNDTLLKSGVPQLFIFGRSDEFIPVEAAETLIEKHPRASVVWLENSGHMGFIEQPEESAKAITDFCRTAAEKQNCERL